MGGHSSRDRTGKIKRYYPVRRAGKGHEDYQILDIKKNVSMIVKKAKLCYPNDLAGELGHY